MDYNNKTYLFGTEDGEAKYVRYSTSNYSKPDEGYPKLQTEEDEYWLNCPETLTRDKKLSEAVDAALSTPDGKVYLFFDDLVGAHVEVNSNSVSLGSLTTLSESNIGHDKPEQSNEPVENNELSHQDKESIVPDPIAKYVDDDIKKNKEIQRNETKNISSSSADQEATVQDIAREKFQAMTVIT